MSEGMSEGRDYVLGEGFSMADFGGTIRFGAEHGIGAWDFLSVA